LLHKWRIEGFGRVVHTEDFSSGLMSLVQLSGLGAFQPNCVLACWPKEAEWREKTAKGAECRAHMIRMVQVAVVFQKVMLLAKGAPFPPLTERLNGNIDIWWIVADGGILLLLPFLLEKHPVWQRCHTRLFAVADNQLDDPQTVKAELEAYMKDFRLSIEVHVKVIDPVLDEEFFLVVEDDKKDLAPSKNQKSDGPEAQVREDELPTRTLSSGSTNSIGSGIARWRKAPPNEDSRERMFPTTPPTSIGRQAAQPLDGVSCGDSQDQTRKVADDTIPGKNTSDTIPGKTSSGSIGGKARDVLFMQSADQLNSHAPCTVQEMALAKGLNKMIAQESRESELVVTNLPDMPPGESAYGYFELVEEMTKHVKRVFLVRGTTTEVITAFT
jgi:potassium/chloride transporter 4/5/6